VLREGIVVGLANHTVLIAKDGTERVVFEWGEIVRDSGGRPIRIVGSCQDITEWKRTEEILRQAAQQMEALSRRLIRAEEDERRRIARELHDETGQALTAVKMHLQGLTQGLDDPTEVRARLEESIRLIEQTHRQVRSISLDLRPALLDDLGLVAALQSYVKRQAQLAGWAARFEPAAGLLACRLEPELETACFRVAQEALTNVVRHAGARTVGVELHLGERELRLCIRDDGVGFDVAAARSRAASGVSLGVLSMEERVALVGGRFAIRSMPGQGTEVAAEFPLTPKRVTRL
jgi:signal transduction histidine kinase